MANNDDSSDPRLEPAENGAQFDRNLELYKRLSEVVSNTLTDAINDAGLKVHSVSTRVKDRASFIDKIIKKKYADPFSQIPDLVGARVVCLFVDDLTKIDKIIRSNFEVIKKEDKITEAPDNTFGYMSIHYECKIFKDSKGPNGLEDITFEIQSRTILMDAWANVSHHLAYKGNASLPESLRRDFHALSALFYIADGQFQLFNASSKRSDANAEELIRKAAGEIVPIDRSTLKAFLRDKFRDREDSHDSDYSELVEQLASCNYVNIQNLDTALDEGLPAALLSETENPPYHDEIPDMRARYKDVGLARHALAKVDPEFKNRISASWAINNFVKNLNEESGDQ
ncbi:GTP pyrophosphokinase family protein [Rhodococcus sp. NPDC056960]|uniref:GTP pyrophosphokinase n=1 Tax=Rhodococcus sp. NPDC056960 TaxID=3345982 RepID=UPI0036442A4F